MKEPRDLILPALVLREPALAANIRCMADWCRENGFLLSPHGKTTMCPQIFERQMDAGAWGITVATVPQALVCLESKIKRVLIANQVVGVANIQALARAMDEHEDADIYCLVDSVASVEHLSENLRKAGAHRSIGVLLEIGKTGWRTGTRSAEQAQDVFNSIRDRSRDLVFGGFEAFEGLAKSSEEAECFLTEVAETAERIGAQSQTQEIIFSVGGSSQLGPVKRVFHQLNKSWKRVLRSGCYVTHDHGIYARLQAGALAAEPTLPRFEAALELWACVQSLPDPGVAILTFGKRDCAYDIELPIALDLSGAVITAINDQHAYLSYPPDAYLAVGARVRFGISHPCTAFDKWRTIPLVDDNYNVIDIYRTCF